jgi:hypothetical protein
MCIVAVVRKNNIGLNYFYFLFNNCLHGAAYIWHEPIFESLEH